MENVEKITPEIPENKNGNEEEKITRRDFLKRAAAITGAIATGALGKEAFSEETAEETGSMLLPFKRIAARYEKFYKEEGARLMHLYHSREGLTHEDQKSKTRNFLGYFDGRNIELIHPKEENYGHTVFDYNREEMSQYDDYCPMPQAGIVFEANKNGFFRLGDGTKLDIVI